MGRIIFVTGTGTGVGKTVMTALLLSHLRSKGIKALALKPFCSGGRGDVDLLGGVMEGELTAREINPWYFPEPVAPLLSARWHRRRIQPRSVVRHIRKMAGRCDVLLVEGSGGLRVPLLPKFDVRDLIGTLHCEVVVVAEDRLGTLNHTLLTLESLSKVRTRNISVVLRGVASRDASQAFNRRCLSELAVIQVFAIPHFGPRALGAGAVKKNAKKFQKTLAMILG
jgi:dethiobiotin synthetase